MKHKCTKCGKWAMHREYIVVGPNDDVICDSCSSVKRDSQGQLVEVMAEYRRGWALELILWGAMGIILGVLFFGAAKEMGLMPFFWGLIP